MSQNIFPDINPATTSGTQLATLLNNFKAALMTGMSGTSRPSELLAGGAWLDTTLAGSPDFKWVYKIYDGTADRTIFTLNLATGDVSFSGSDSIFEISKISADTVGPILKYVKARIANSGQVLSGDVIGEQDFYGTTDAGSEVLSAAIKALAAEDFTASESGSAISVEGTLIGAAVKTEWARFTNGRLGLGLTAPETALHVRSTTGIKSSRRSDDAVGAKVIIRKARIAGTGATQNSDVIGQVDFNTTDDATAENTSAMVEVSAIEAHTASAQGTQIAIKTATTGSASATTKVTIGDKVTVAPTLNVTARELVSQNIATTATIAALSATHTVVEFTGSTATIIQGINAAQATKVITVHNRSSATVTLAHENGSASANDRLKLPNAKDVTIIADSSAELIYVSAESRWKVKSGAGSGGSARTVGTLQSISGGGTITVDGVTQDQVILVEGSGGAQTASTTPFSNTAVTDGTIITLVGTDNDKPLTIVVNNATDGVIGDIPVDGIVLYAGTVKKFMKINAQNRWYFLN